MKALLSIEWLKIKHYRTFWVLAGLFAGLLLLWNLLILFGAMKLGGGGINLLNNSYTFPSVWDNVCHWTKLFSGLLAIVIVILTTNEYQFKTNRQSVIDGWQRAEFFHAKWWLVLVMSIVVTLYTFILGFVFAVSNGSSLSLMGDHIEKVLYVFILNMNYFGFALTLSFFLKRSGMTIVIFLLYCYIIEIIIQQLLNWKIDARPGDFLPMQCSAELLNLPLIDLANNAMHKTSSSHTILMITSIFWIVVYYIIGRTKLLRSDW